MVMNAPTWLMSLGCRHLLLRIGACQHCGNLSLAIQGIKIKDAASKKKALKALAKRRASGPAAMEA